MKFTQLWTAVSMIDAAIGGYYYVYKGNTEAATFWMVCAILSWLWRTK